MATLSPARDGSLRLDRRLCLARQQAVRAELERTGCDALVVRDRRMLTRLFDYRAREIFPAAGLIPVDGPSVLALRSGHDEAVAAEVALPFEAMRMSSLLPDIPDAAFRALAPRLSGLRRLAFDADPPLAAAGEGDRTDGRAMLARLVRRKDEDEVALIAAAAAAAETAYAAIEPLLVPGTREIDLYAAFQSAAVSALGEPIGELGNDYRGGAPGGMPRRAPLAEGDLVPLDTGVSVRGYYSDLCRTYPVGGRWEEPQLAAARRVLEALDLAQSLIAPGVSCRAVYREVAAFLDGWRGWRFEHHLGHGVGLSPVETPRINPNWDDSFEVGDVFTLEPGLYAPELRAGVRIENDYVLSPTGLVRLSDSGAAVPAP